MESEVASCHQITNEEEILTILESVHYIYQETTSVRECYLRVFKLSKQLSLVHDGGHRSLGDDSSLRHFFHRVKVLRLLFFYFPDLCINGSTLLFRNLLCQ